MSNERSGNGAALIVVWACLLNGSSCGGVDASPVGPGACPGGSACPASEPAVPAPSAVAYGPRGPGGGAPGSHDGTSPRLPQPAVCSVPVQGAPPENALRDAAEQALGPWLRQCARDAGRAEARLSIQFAVGPQGCAEQVTIRADPRDDRLSGCVAVGFYSLKLTSAAAGMATAVRFPLVVTTAVR